MAAVLAGAAVPTYAEPSGFAAQDRADAICIAVIATAWESLPADTTVEARLGLTGVLNYFLGKIRGRHPALEIADLYSPNYMASLQSEVASSMQRCVDEGMKMGLELEAAGRAMRMSKEGNTQK